MLPGTYEVRLTTDGQTFSQELEVEIDPRVAVTSAELSSLLEFQNEIAAALARVVALSDRTQDSTGPTHAEASSIAQVLTSLASDLESADAAPTEPQRELFDHTVDRLERVEAQ